MNLGMLEKLVKLADSKIITKNENLKKPKAKIASLDKKTKKA